MSVRRTVYLTCDGSDLLMSRLCADSTMENYREALTASRAERSAMTAKCAFDATEAHSVKDARQTAGEQGWIRHREVMHIYAGSEKTERRTFDLCPSCAPLADPAEQQRQAEQLVAEAVLQS